MAEFDRPSVSARPGTVADVDQGLRSYMLKVYNYMTIGLVITGVVAYGAFAAAVTQVNGQITGLTSFGSLLFESPLRWVVILSPLAFVLVLSFGINKLSAGMAQLLFWLFAAVMGLSLSSIFLVYTGQSITQVFFITAATFGAMSLYGYTTKRDLTGIGSFLIMGLFGLIIASIVNIFLQSSGLGFAISIIGVLIFVGLTAWDTQKIKNNYDVGLGAEVLAKGAIMGALSLYLDFINIFLFLLRIMGNNRS